ncbi:hypothetical protein [Chondromyces crocatus]|uniref:Uncharacterized protein n=1 Tax=Chondromyces crocatus TaxID=52 RepID=A0A0K1ERN0_CHOCO|nr:hypothetical protein [Chondromyces crocatus]AKT43501.1 uncharacterized protein CMC5_077330 [Chondromyces crocatus]
MSNATRPPSDIAQVARVRITGRHEGLGLLCGLLSLFVISTPPLAILALQGLEAAFALPALQSIEGVLLALYGPAFVTAAILAPLGFLIITTSIPSAGHAEVTAGPDGLSVRSSRRARRISHDDIQTAFLIPGTPPRVELRLTHGRVLDLHVPTEDDASRLLGALGFDLHHHSITIPLDTPDRQITAGCITLPVALFVWMALVTVILPSEEHSPWFIGVLSLACFVSVWLSRRAARPTRVTVGRDGVRIEGAFTRDFVSFTDLTDLELQRDRLRLICRDTLPPRELRAPIELLEALARRVREASAQPLHGPHDHPTHDALERRDRDPAAWREDLRRLLGTGDYRITPRLTPEDALLILDDSTAPPSRRIGAALALRIVEHPDARTRIRIAADTSADEALRAALEEAAEERLDAEAIARVSQVR